MTEYIEKMYMKFPWVNIDTGLIILRLGIGAIFIMTGWMKVSDMNLTVQYFASMGFATFWAYLVALVELVGGIVVLLGLGIYTRVSAKLLAIVMIVATYVTRSNLAAAMPSFILFFTVVALMCTGPGKYSVIKEKGGMMM